MPVFFGELMVLAHVGVFADEAAGHGPLVDAEAQNHPDVQADEREQDAGDDEDVQREEAG